MDPQGDAKKNYLEIIQKGYENQTISEETEFITPDGSRHVILRTAFLVKVSQGLRMAAVVRAWLTLMATMPSRDPANTWFADWAKNGADFSAALDNPALFPDSFRSDARLRAAILNA